MRIKNELYSCCRKNLVSHGWKQYCGRWYNCTEATARNPAQSKTRMTKQTTELSDSSKTPPPDYSNKKEADIPENNVSFCAQWRTKIQRLDIWFMMFTHRRTGFKQVRDKQKCYMKVGKITCPSLSNVLWLNLMGHHARLSAKRYECFRMKWSNNWCETSGRF
jgi:hypothetical protein